eukprot:scaffold630_cov350-Pavlova_lutheri.AAC.5
MRRRPRPLGTPFSLLGKDGFDRKTSRVRSRDDPPWETGAAVGGKGRGPVPRVTPLPRTRLASQRKGKRHGVREGNRSPIRPDGGRTHRTPNEILCDDGHRAGKKRPKVTDGPGRQGSIVEATSPRPRGGGSRTHPEARLSPCSVPFIGGILLFPPSDWSNR